MRSVCTWVLLGVLLGVLLCGSALAQPYPPGAYAPIPAEPGYAPPPPPPGPPERYVLERAHWHWDGRTYVWIPAHWAGRRVGYGYHEYVPGRWVARYGSWVWLPAHWR